MKKQVISQTAKSLLSGKSTPYRLFMKSWMDDEGDEIQYFYIKIPGRIKQWKWLRVQGTTKKKMFDSKKEAVDWMKKYRVISKGIREIPLE
jgi:hypothetical protein